MLTLEDLHVAAIVRENRLVPPEHLTRLMGDVDGLPAAPGLAARLLEMQLLDADSARRVVATARRRVGLEADKHYTDIALNGTRIDEALLERLMMQTTQGGRIGSKLVAEGVLTPEQDQKIVAAAREKLHVVERDLLARERARGFAPPVDVADQERQILSEPTTVLKEHRVLGGGAGGGVPVRGASSGARPAKATGSTRLKPGNAAPATPRGATPRPQPRPAPPAPQAGGMIPAELEEQILSEPTVQVNVGRVPNPSSSGAVKAQEEAILAEPTLKMRKEELAPKPDPAGKRSGKIARPSARAPADAEDTNKYGGVLAIPGASKPDASTKKIGKATSARQGAQKDEPLEPSQASLAIVSPGGPTGTELYGATGRPSGTAEQPSLAGKTLRVLSGYEIDRELGRGAMGVVYVARETQLKRQVALKVLSASDHPEASERFMREARAIAQLDHPGIVPVYQYGEADGHYFIAMKLIEGRPLKTIAQKPLSAKRAAAIMEQVARSMAYAHEQGVVHRDLKPANILVEAGDKPWVVDFGIAKMDTEVTMTQAGEIMGTPAYMSPEQALQLPVTQATDVYSLGAVLYAITVGQAPFPGQNALEVLPKVAIEEPAKPSALRKDIPKDLETIILVAMDKEQDRRYPSALALAEDLRRFQAGEPIAGRRPSAFYLARRWVRRHVLQVGAAALVVVAALGAYSLRGSKAEADQQAQVAKMREKRQKQLKGKLEAAQVAVQDCEAALASGPLDAAIGKVKTARDVISEAEGLAPGEPKVAEWRTKLETAVHAKASERREKARKDFLGGSAQSGKVALAEAVGLEPDAKENKEIEQLIDNRPVVTIRWRTPCTITWVKLDDDLHPTGDWQSPAESTPDHAVLAAPETKNVRIRATGAGRMELILDLAAKPGSVVELPPLPLYTEETKDMCFVPPGHYLLGGRAKGSTRGSQEEVKIEVPGFAIDKTEVTRQAFVAFVQAKGYERKDLWSEKGLAWLDERKAAGPLTGPKDCDLTAVGRGGEPVTGVSYFEAEAFARWVGRQLPAQDQLEAAARGALGGTYPWGNRYAKEFFQLGRANPRPTGTFPLDTSAIGCVDLGGNVREWTCDTKKDWASEQGGVVYMIVKGACFADSENDALQWAKGAACTARDPKDRAPDLGFRCVKILNAQKDF